MKSVPARWQDLARTTLELCRLRSGPEAVPHAPSLLLALIVAGTVLDLLLGDVLGDGANALPRSLLSSGVVLALCWVALALNGLGARYVQTVSALLACSLLFSLLQVPLAMLAGAPPATAAELTTLQMLMGWLTLLVFLWQVCVYAHVMRQALDSSLGLAFALVVSWLVAFWALDSLLFGAAP